MPILVAQQDSLMLSLQRWILWLPCQRSRTKQCNILGNQSGFLDPPSNRPPSNQDPDWIWRAKSPLFCRSFFSFPGKDNWLVASTIPKFFQEKCIHTIYIYTYVYCTCTYIDTQLYLQYILQVVGMVVPVLVFKGFDCQVPSAASWHSSGGAKGAAPHGYESRETLPK